MKKIIIYLIITLIFFFISSSTIMALPKYSDLYSYFIDLKGWETEEPTGVNLSGPVGEMVSAEKKYKKGLQELHVKILGGTAAILAWAPFTMTINLETPEEIIETLKVKDFNTGVRYHKKDKTGIVVVQIFANGKNENKAVFVIEYINIHYKDVIKIIEKFPLNKIKDAFK